MAAQQTMIAETIRGMKLALRRRDDDSDSDSSIHQHTNRGNKLKRKAAYVREGRLDTTGGRSYRRKIDHAGHKRYIIHQNPPRLDEDGDLVEGDDDDEEGNGSPDEENPFGETKLEHLLGHLTAAWLLPEHPSLSYPYTAKALTEMAENARDMLHRERETLWQMKRLLLRFRGDETWAPLERVETVHDDLLLDGDTLESLNDTEPSIVESQLTAPTGNIGAMEVDAPAMSKQTNGIDHDLAGIKAPKQQTNGVHAIDMAPGMHSRPKMEEQLEQSIGLETSLSNGVGADDPAVKATGDTDKDQHMDVDGAPHALTSETVNGDGEQTEDTNGLATAEVDLSKVRQSIEPESPAESASGQFQHRMTTRAKARTPPSPHANGTPLASPVPSSIPSISNFFIPPFTSLPDRDFGLPAAEAEETRRLLLLYVQKQEEVVRGAESLMKGLLKADLSRKQVWKWSRAERHTGGWTSDGEDWYDKEEWGLEEDLVKGKDEEEVEEDSGRKGRRRREGGKGKVA